MNNLATLFIYRVPFNRKNKHIYYDILLSFYSKYNKESRNTTDQTQCIPCRSLTHTTVSSTILSRDRYEREFSSSEGRVLDYNINCSLLPATMSPLVNNI